MASANTAFTTRMIVPPDMNSISIGGMMVLPEDGDDYRYVDVPKANVEDLLGHGLTLVPPEKEKVAAPAKLNFKRGKK